MHDLAEQLDIPLASNDLTPIAFIPCGVHEATFALAHAMRRRGYYIAPAVFPGVPYNKSGLRLTVSLHNTDREVEDVMAVLSEERALLPALQRADESGVVPVSVPSNPLVDPAD